MSARAERPQPLVPDLIVVHRPAGVRMHRQDSTKPVTGPTGRVPEVSPAGHQSPPERVRGDERFAPNRRVHHNGYTGQVGLVMRRSSVRFRQAAPQESAIYQPKHRSAALHVSASMCPDATRVQVGCLRLPRSHKTLRRSAHAGERCTRYLHRVPPHRRYPAHGTVCGG